MTDKATKRWIEQVVAALRDTADRIERGEVAPSRFNMRAPVRVAGVEDHCVTYEIGDKRALFVETIVVTPAAEDEIEPIEPTAQPMRGGHTDA